MIDRAFVDTAGFRFGTLKSYRDLNFLPGAVKYGDLPGILSLSAPHDLMIAGEGGSIPQIVADTYKAAGREDGVTSVDAKNPAAAFVKALR